MYCFYYFSAVSSLSTMRRKNKHCLSLTKLSTFNFLNYLQSELLSVSSQLSTLPRRAELLSRPGDVSWRKYFPIMSMTLSSSDKTGTPCPKSRAVVYTILIPVCVAPVSPPNVWSVSSPCIELGELSDYAGEQRAFIWWRGALGCIS